MPVRHHSASRGSRTTECITCKGAAKLIHYPHIAFASGHASWAQPFGIRVSFANMQNELIAIHRGRTCFCGRDARVVDVILRSFVLKSKIFKKSHFMHYICFCLYLTQTDGSTLREWTQLADLPGGLKADAVWTRFVFPFSPDDDFRFLSSLSVAAAAERTSDSLLLFPSLFLPTLAASVSTRSCILMGLWDNCEVGTKFTWWIIFRFQVSNQRNLATSARK